MTPATFSSRAWKLGNIAARHVTGPVAWFLLAAAVLLAAACGGTTAADSRERLQVVATTAILADLVESVGGPRLEVHTVVRPGVDIHSFQTTPQDSRAISKAALIVSNGSGLDDFMGPVIRSAKNPEAVHAVASAGLDETGTDARSGSGADPHFWQNPLYVVEYVERIRDGLTQADPEGTPVYQSNADAYIRQLRELDQEIALTLAQVPPKRRHLVTFHDAFGHFARRYGWQSSAFVPGDGTDFTPGTIIALMELAEAKSIPAMFAEPQLRPGVMESFSRDANISVGTIYSDGLDETVSSYLEMMRFNARSLIEHLR